MFAVFAFTSIKAQAVLLHIWVALRVGKMEDIYAFHRYDVRALQVQPVHPYHSSFFELPSPPLCPLCISRRCFRHSSSRHFFFILTPFIFLLIFLLVFLLLTLTIALVVIFNIAHLPVVSTTASSLFPFSSSLLYHVSFTLLFLFTLLFYFIPSFLHFILLIRTFFYFILFLSFPLLLPCFFQTLLAPLLSLTTFLVLLFSFFFCPFLHLFFFLFLLFLLFFLLLFLLFSPLPLILLLYFQKNTGQPILDNRVFSRAELDYITCAQHLAEVGTVSTIITFAVRKVEIAERCGTSILCFCCVVIAFVIFAHASIHALFKKERRCNEVEVI
mmetsp:Transcript_32815/g.84744  ORF Transcript_32815/g.84744 Transcript_32815/m.84744 type:complete len:329 (+) Transcript_32815:1683-2669(+)